MEGVEGKGLLLLTVFIWCPGALGVGPNPLHCSDFWHDDFLSFFWVVQVEPSSFLAVHTLSGRCPCLQGGVPTCYPWPSEERWWGSLSDKVHSRGNHETGAISDPPLSFLWMVMIFWPSIERSLCVPEYGNRREWGAYLYEGMAVTWSC